MAFNEVLIDVRKLYRKFSRSSTQTRRLGVRQVMRNLCGLPAKDGAIQPGEFWSLKDVTFSIERGECVGILGLNGAGKSTLLKIIGGLLLPSEGEVRVRGAVDSLIELGTGFHPSLSGRENIFIRCALNNMSRRQTENIFERIVDFAELHEFIDMPVKNYSSGMYARLGFATAVFGNPDVLLVDEVLSVGDFTFRQKCLDKMNELKKRASILFVSHSFGAIRMFCQRGIVLERGGKIFDGPADEAVDCLIARQEALAAPKNVPVKERAENEEGPRAVWGPRYTNPDKIQDIQIAWCDSADQPCHTFHRHEPIFLRFRFRLLYRPQKLVIGIPIWNAQDELVTSFSTDVQGVDLVPDENGYVSGRLEIQRDSFNAGRLHAVVAVVDGPEFIYREHLPSLTIHGHHPRIFGSAQLPHRWLTTPESGQTAAAPFHTRAMQSFDGS